MKREAVQVFTVVKDLLKSRGLSYSDLANELGISLSSVKRILNGNDINLSKLSQIASFLGLDLFELIEMSKKITQSKYFFNLEQEKFLSKNINHFKVFRYLLLKYSEDEIRSLLGLRDLQLESILIKLDKLNLIQYYEKSKIKLIANFPFQWIENGPLENKYNELIIDKLANEILVSGVNRESLENETNVFVKELLLSSSELIEMRDRLNDVIKDYELLTKMRLKTKSKYEIVAVANVSGAFSWWE